MACRFRASPICYLYIIVRQILGDPALSWDRADYGEAIQEVINQSHGPVNHPTNGVAIVVEEEDILSTHRHWRLSGEGCSGLAGSYQGTNVELMESVGTHDMVNDHDNTSRQQELANLARPQDKSAGAVRLLPQNPSGSVGPRR